MPNAGGPETGGLGKPVLSHRPRRRCWLAHYYNPKMQCDVEGSRSKRVTVRKEERWKGRQQNALRRSGEKNYSEELKNNFLDVIGGSRRGIGSRVRACLVMRRCHVMCKGTCQPTL